MFFDVRPFVILLCPHCGFTYLSGHYCFNLEVKGV